MEQIRKPVTDRKKALHTAEKLSEFIVQNFHFCPINEFVSIPDCEGWKSGSCKDCILRNAENLN